jgi:hypothetical protein
MLSALSNGVKGGVWYSLMDKVCAPATLRRQAEYRRFAANAIPCVGDPARGDPERGGGRWEYQRSSSMITVTLLDLPFSVLPIVIPTSQFGIDARVVIHVEIRYLRSNLPFRSVLSCSP